MRPTDRTARIAELALSSTAIQRCSYRAVALLTDIAAGHAADVDPEHARLFVEEALEAVITAEILSGRGAHAPRPLNQGASDDGELSTGF